MIINQEKLNGCKPQVMQLVSWLEQIYGTVKVTSGYRSQEYNDSLPNSSKTSYHIKGLAIDIFIKDVSVIKIVAKVLENIQKFPVRGIGIDIYQNYVHFDFRPTNDIVYWVYGKNGREA